MRRYQEAGVFLPVLQTHEIFADEAWTHGSPPLRRYWCFFGGILGLQSDLSRLDTRLRAVAHGANLAEIKWSNLKPGNLTVYKKFVDCLFTEIENGAVRYRQMFCDRSMYRVVPYGEPPVSDLDVQFKLCYQFLKHAFGLRYLDPLDQHEVLVRLDGHSSQKHKKRLALFSREIPGILNHPGLTLKVTYEDSAKSPRIQACDVIIGAAGSHGNKMHLLRPNGQRGMTAKQKARHDLSLHIYNALRRIDATERGSKAFNWFETTGKDGDRTNFLNHKLRIWKFMPAQYKVDKGWQNDHLDKQGLYVGRDLDNTLRYASGTFTY